MSIIIIVKTRANHGKKSRLNSQKNEQSDLDKIFYKVVYHHIIYICDFLGEF